MDNTIIAISKSNHLKHSFLPLFGSKGFGPLSNLSTCQIYLAETKTIANHFPIAFTKNKKEGFEMNCLMSLMKNQNVYIDKDGEWKGMYLPIFFRCLPFIIGKNEQTGEKLLCFRSDIDLVKDSQIENFIPFFDDAGNLSSDLNKIMETLDSIEKNSQNTQLALETLEKNDMFKEWPITMKFTDGEKAVPGLYQINYQKFRELSKDKLFELFKTGGLQIAYSQIISTDNLRKLAYYHTKFTENLSTSKNLREVTIEKERAVKKKELDDLVQNLIDSD